jgi:4'-phosphopantetheinyl transferase
MSCSSSGDVGLVAVVRGARIGIDVEHVRDEDVEAAVAEGWLAESERAAIAGLPSADRARALTRAWVQKEAVLKGQGVGLWADLARTVTPTADSGRIGTWTLSPIDGPRDVVVSVALRPTSFRTRIRRPRIVVR